MSREIHCVECNLYLGEIRDAKLRKEISFLCVKCETSRKALKMKEATKGYGGQSDYSDVFADMFGGAFKK